MTKRIMWGVVALIALLSVLTAAVVAADSEPMSFGQAAPLPNAPIQATLAPGQSHWYTFGVPIEYSIEQYKRDQRRGADITPQRIRLEFANPWNGDLAHNTGFRLYDPDRANRIANFIEPETKRDEAGMVMRDLEGNRLFEPNYWAIGSPEYDNPTERDRAADPFLGRAKRWQGVLHSPGTYYIEVYNASALPLDYTLTISGPNLSLTPTS